MPAIAHKILQQKSLALGSLRYFQRSMMTSSYDEAIGVLNSLQTNAEVLEALRQSGGRMNDRSIPEMREYIKRLGYKLSDLDALNVIHVTGTKGKGSTCAFTDSILRQAGYRTGLFTSPHLVEVRERIRLDDRPISREQFTKYFFDTHARLLAAKDLESEIPMPAALPTYFRFLSLMAIHMFISEKVDAGIFEVGIGGTYDATNVFERPVVCGITSVGLDHQSLLGNTRAEIAHHKGGILKANVPGFTVEQLPEVMPVLQQRAQELKASSFEVVPALSALSFVPVDIKLGLSGEHQQSNASLAVALATTWMQKQNKALTSEVKSQIVKGLTETRWPGRCQTIHIPSQPRLVVHIDGAHTPESMEACIRWYGSLHHSPSSTRILVFNCTHDRKSSVLLAPLAVSHLSTPFAHVCFCPNVVSAQSSASDLLDKTSHHDQALAAQHVNAAEWKTLTQQQQDSTTHVFDDIQSILAWVEQFDPSQEHIEILITGSLHLAGASMAALQQRYHVDVI